MKLTPRQITVLTETFDGAAPDYRDMTAAQRTGRVRVMGSLRFYGPHTLIERGTNILTVLGLEALAPYYADKQRIADALEVRRAIEAQNAADKAREEQERDALRAGLTEKRNAKLVGGYRRVLSDHHFDHAALSDELILALGNAMAAVEMHSGNVIDA